MIFCHIGSEQHLYRSLCENMYVTDVGLILGEVEENHVDQLYSFYLSDFVHYVHKSNHNKAELCEMEYKVCSLLLTDFFKLPYTVDNRCTRCSDSWH